MQSLLEWKDSQKTESSADSVASASEKGQSDAGPGLAKAVRQQSPNSSQKGSSPIAHVGPCHQAAKQLFTCCGHLLPASIFRASSCLARTVHNSITLAAPTIMLAAPTVMLAAPSMLAAPIRLAPYAWVHDTVLSLGTICCLRTRKHIP